MADQRRSEVFRSAYPVEDEFPPIGQSERLGQKPTVVVHLHALVSKRFHEGIVFLFCSLCPWHVIEEEFADVLGCEPRQLEPRSVHDGLA